MRKILALMFTLLLTFTVFAVFAEDINEDALVITGLPDSGIVSEDKYYSIAALLNGRQVECEWTVSDSRAARISSAKKLRTKEVGEAISFTLTAEHNATGLRASVELVIVPDAKNVKIQYNGEKETSFEFSAELSNGPVQFALSGVASPEKAGTHLIWTSSDERVATVDADGLVTVMEAGRAVITVSTANDKHAKAVIYSYYSPESIEISAPIDLAVEQTARLACTVYPENAEGTPLRYTSSDEKTIAVNNNGEIEAKRAGMADITVSAPNGVSATVTIESYKPVESISFEDSITVAIGETRPLTVTVKPEDAKYKELTFYSEAPDVAVIDESGNVTGISEGKAIIGAKSSNGIIREKTIHVKFVSVKSLVNDSFFESLVPGETLVFPVSLNPANATNRKLYFRSDNPNIASVDENGLITAHAEGRTEIYCKSESESCNIITLIVRVVKDENVLPLEGIIVGLNPGHQITRDFTQLPVAPGSSQTKNANSGYVIGVETRNPEYQVTLDVSLRLRDKLEALGATVVMTRTVNDVKINNIDRAKMLNEAGCDVALQIHCNNSDDEWKTGFFAYTKSKDLISQAIGDYIYLGTHEVAGTEISKCKLHNGYMSLNWSTTPSILLELGYMSNPEEDVLLGTPEYQDLLAEGITRGLVYFFN